MILYNTTRTSHLKVKHVLYFYISTSRSMCVQCPIWLFCVVPRLGAFLVCCSGVV